MFVVLSCAVPFHFLKSYITFLRLQSSRIFVSFRCYDVQGLKLVRLAGFAVSRALLSDSEGLEWMHPFFSNSCSVLMYQFYNALLPVL